MVESVSQQSITTEEILVSYSGIEEYVPIHRLTPSSEQKVEQEINQETASREDLSAPIATDEWKSFAAFQVELQTRQAGDRTEQRLQVYNLNTGTTETWSNLKTEMLQQWMVGQTSAVLPSAKVEITQVQVRQAPQAGMLTTIGERSLQSVRANQPFMLILSLQVSGLSIAHYPEQSIHPSIHPSPDQPQSTDRSTDQSLDCDLWGYARCYARNLATGAIVDLHHSPIEFHRTAEQIYGAELPEVIVAEPGIYRLFIDLTVSGSPGLSTSFKMTALQVM